MVYVFKLLQPFIASTKNGWLRFMSFTSPGRGFRINVGSSPVLTAPKDHNKILKRLEVEALSGDVDDAPEFRIENLWKIKPFPDVASTSSLFGIDHSGCSFLLLFITIRFIIIIRFEIRPHTSSNESVKFTLNFWLVHGIEQISVYTLLGWG